MPARIAGLETRVVRAPLPRHWGPGVDAVHLILAALETDDGRRATGLAWTPTIGPGAVKALIDGELAPAAIGLTAHPATAWDSLWWHLHEGGLGLTGLALAAVDTALWDLRAREAGRGLVDELGRRRDAVPAYGSGVNLHYTLDELVAQAERWVAAGFGAVKVKVGKPDLDEDVERVAAVRAAIGPRRRLMIDANQRWDVPTARRAIAALARFELHWIEEPLPSDDIAGLAALRRSIDVPVATGENVYTAHQFRDLLAAGAVDVVQPNVARVGGITPLLRIAELARVFDVPVVPHLLPELSAQLACALPLPAPVEDVEDASFAALGLLAGPPPVTIAGGVARVGDHLGHGLRFADAP
jgi:L-alanine-DL-glutamate epimerase-like enolase superfamily enzyme